MVKSGKFYAPLATKAGHVEYVKYLTKVTIGYFGYQNSLTFVIMDVMPFSDKLSLLNSVKHNLSWKKV